MKITYDDQYLITVSDDASLFIHKIADKEGRGKREKDVTYAEEILITKSDLEEKVNMTQILIFYQLIRRIYVRFCCFLSWYKEYPKGII